jgi:hypothetical protein
MTPRDTLQIVVENRVGAPHSSCDRPTAGNDVLGIALAAGGCLQLSSADALSVSGAQLDQSD